MTEIKQIIGIKHDQEKPSYNRIPFEALGEINAVMAFGAKKYDRDNWKNGTDWSRQWNSVFRHLVAWNAGEDKDPESNLSHLAHAACGILFLLTFEREGLGTDDRKSN